MGLAVAVKIVIADVPPIFKTALPAWVSPPVPVSAVATVSVLLFVNAIAVTVRFGMKKVPVSACALVVKEYSPAPAVNVPLLVIPRLNCIAEPIELVQVAPIAMVTSPVNNLAPVTDETVKLPLVAPPIVVVPVTVKANPAAVKPVPLPIIRLPVMVKPTTVFVEVVPLKIRLPVIAVVPTCSVFTPLPLIVKL